MCIRDSFYIMYKFQYPLSGRRLCSPSCKRPMPLYDDVSVPSIGSKAVQPDIYLEVVSVINLFQYPLSGRRLCSIRA